MIGRGAILFLLVIPRSLTNFAKFNWGPLCLDKLGEPDVINVLLARFLRGPITNPEKPFYLKAFQNIQILSNTWIELFWFSFSSWFREITKIRKKKKKYAPRFEYLTRLPNLFVASAFKLAPKPLHFMQNHAGLKHHATSWVG